MKKTEQKYKVGSKEYDSFEELPEKYKVLFEDKNKDGIPDLFEDIGGEGSIVSSSVSHKIIINDKTYKTWDDVPEEFRHLKDKIKVGSVNLNHDEVKTINVNETTQPQTVPVRNMLFIAFIIILGTIIFLKI